MPIESKYLIPAAMFLGMLLSAAAQTATPTAAPSAIIDPAVLARANAGDAAAQVAMGEHYAQAAATDHDKVQMAGDYQQVLAWYRKAADQNYIPGEMHLAVLYRDGGGKTIPRDMQQAATWYRRAADQGDPTAQGTLGVLYSIGQGVPHNDVEAYFWLDLAASVKGPNQEKYAANRQMIGERITADQLSDVQDRVAAWKAAHPRPDSTN
ncbi:MAG TPA: tetratricopeptide repeat protein [Terracidiphilus sp.]|nr:tetratricopeptide repeat protein [Terracidiphilus sp.]